VVIFAILAGTHFGGVLGLLWALPLAAVLKVVFSYFYGKLIEEETA
jgi:predicted PurR-regulated permease PerM